MSETLINKQEFAMWREHPVTVFVSKILQEAHDQYTEYLGSANAHLEEKDVIRGRALGIKEGLELFLLMRIEDAPEPEIVEGEFVDVKE